jgi:electron transfer flavoprotein alpha subunit
VATSATSIANAALRVLGERRIASLDEESKTARLMKDAYDDVRQETLRTMKPRFATTRASLSANATAPAWGYDYAYDLPGDCLRVVNVLNESRLHWEVEGRQIVTDLGAPLKITYISDFTDVPAMDAGFRQALAANLAAEVAEPLTGTMSESEKAATVARARAAQAAGADGQEATNANVVGSEWLDARYSRSRLDRVPSDGEGTPL